MGTERELNMPRVSVEMASVFGWERYVGSKGKIIGMRSFGASVVMGMRTIENIRRTLRLQNPIAPRPASSYHRLTSLPRRET